MWLELVCFVARVTRLFPMLEFQIAVAMKVPVVRLAVVVGPLWMRDLKTRAFVRIVPQVLGALLVKGAHTCAGVVMIPADVEVECVDFCLA